MDVEPLILQSKAVDAEGTQRISPRYDTTSLPLYQRIYKKLLVKTASLRLPLTSPRRAILWLCQQGRLISDWATPFSAGKGMNKHVQG